MISAAAIPQQTHSGGGDKQQDHLGMLRKNSTVLKVMVSIGLYFPSTGIAAQHNVPSKQA